MKRILFVLIGILSLTSSLSVFAMEDTEMSYEGIPYVCTGVAESKEDPRWRAYPLKLMFTGSGKAYISEVSTSIRSSSGKTIFQAKCETPWLLVKLEPGKYSVSARAEGGTTKTVVVQVPSSGQHELAIRFPEVYRGGDY